MTTKSSSGTPFSIVRVLAILAFLACINAASAATTSKGVNAQPRVLNFEQNDVSSQRFLRTEERKLGISLSGLEQAASGTKSWAAKLIQKFQLKWWQLRKKSPNDVFTKLKLKQTGPNLFESPGFSKWVAYVTKNSKESPDMTIFSTLAYHYSDDALVKMFAAAKEVDGTKALATKLEGMQLTNWVHAEKSPDYVFKTLALDKMGAKGFENPLFARWTEFITKANTKDPDVAVYTTLRAHYSDEALAKMIAAATKVESTENLAANLRSLQFEKWVSQNKTPESVNAMLGVATNTDDLTKKVSRDYEKYYGKKPAIDRDAAGPST
ncbi:hypothetical protein PI124_g10666 [Phytophthora idaei]|nr:hypothetical protein PI125_g13071 [Phytophthora idaei]KAG3140008.1 hypothetical protein PI126_g16214 [Phytophthora idaei]KAG3244557.1 hypothetical protein PI124_g10666 [Phytophthora idaei]